MAAATRLANSTKNNRRKNLPAEAGEVNVAFLLLTSELSKPLYARASARAEPACASSRQSVECWDDSSGSAGHPGLPRLQEAAAAQGNWGKPEVYRVSSCLPGTGQYPDSAGRRSCHRSFLSFSSSPEVKGQFVPFWGRQRHFAYQNDTLCHSANTTPGLLHFSLRP